MSKEIVSQKQASAVIIMYTLGSTLVLGAGGFAKNDVWLAILISILMSAPILLLYCKIQMFYPGKNIYEIFDSVFGKVIGKVMSLVFIWYSFHLGSLVIRNFTEFIVTVSLQKTPQNIVGLFMIFLCIWAVRAGIETIGRWTAIMLPVTIFVIFAVTLLFAPLFNFKNLKPVLYNGMGPVIDSAFSVFAFPFAETVIFLAVLSHLKEQKSVYKVYFLNLLISGISILLVSVRTLLTLGVPNISILFFPTFASVRLINIGDFLQRIEITVAMVFLFAGFIKISICLYSTSIGIAHLFRFNSYRQVVALLGLAMSILSVIIYSNTSEMFDWSDKIYKYYAFIFQVVLPGITFIVIEARKMFSRKRKLQQSN
ncbi:GerAB/ArcD/ProY family transporter [Ruminiclostridium papyrosolvens]|uniref:Spore germination protein n=1 Tax=Ruminiclostridium papyrosolvens C7 TaxID=1330534 RepID=U4R2D4_9FIRM|nr:endospore germination permease [Ruminiclostridium papyrosolvens]EPR12299.1 spore germination protein [Ruminiclostridium papyrosolvens C7]